MQISFDHVTAETTSVSSFYFKTERPLHYTAGQFVELTIPHAHPDTRGIKRWFTLSSSPTQDLLSITTRLAAKDSSTFKRALRRLKPGTKLTISEPMGDFVLPKLLQTPLIFVAGGIGITPFLSILRWLADTGERRPIKLLQSVRFEDDIMFQDVFDNAAIHATIVIEKPTSAWGGERGKLSAEIILGLEPLSDDTLIYIAGPEPLLEQLNDDFHHHGVRRQQIVTDYFPGYSSL